MESNVIFIARDWRASFEDGEVNNALQEANKKNNGEVEIVDGPDCGADVFFMVFGPKGIKSVEDIGHILHDYTWFELPDCQYAGEVELFLDSTNNQLYGKATLPEEFKGECPPLLKDSLEWNEWGLTQERIDTYRSSLD